MRARNQAHTYKKVSLETATPARIVLMLYDGILRFTGEAGEAFDLPEGRERLEIINNKLIRAQAIIAELQGNLDLKVEGPLPQTLFDLYGFWFDQLGNATKNKHRAPIKTVLPQVREIRDAWEQMMKQTEKDGSQEPVRSLSHSA